MDDALANAQEAAELYVEGLREDGESLDQGIVRRRRDARLTTDDLRRLLDR